MRTVFHVSDADAYEASEAKVRNLLGDDSLDVAEVAVLVDRSAVIDAAAGKLGSTTEELTELGATVKLCSNAFSGAEAETEVFPDSVELVSSGVGELTRLQNGEWAYIRL